MKNWKEYNGHIPKIEGKRQDKLYDNTIYTFDIESTSYIILNNKQYNTIEYLNFSEKEKEDCLFYSTMYIWMFSIDNEVYYGRTWEEFEGFLYKLEIFGSSVKKIVYVHNLSFEFQFLRNILKFKNVMSRKSRKVMKCECEEFNIEFRCTYFMTNSSLEKLPDIYNLNTKKLVGNIDYQKIRHSKTQLSKKEMQYCENDCLVVYEYIKRELEEYKTTKNTPFTSTGHVRREFKELIKDDYSYKNKVRKCLNCDGHIYNLLVEALSGGYTHANFLYTDEIIKNVESFDFTSSYPYVMTTHKFPMTSFKRCNIKSEKQLVKNFAYILVVRFKNIKCKYFNNFISLSKCRRIKGGRYDNGRIISAEELEIVLTDIDFKFFLKSYTGSYEILESYFAKYDYLPKVFIDFILDKYVIKTQYKNVKGKEVEYNLEKAKFNSLYGMCVTNNIRDVVIFDNELGWSEIPLTNEEILQELENKKKNPFLSFAWGVWVTAHARNNLLENLIKLDKFVLYADTDSLKLKEGFDKKVINEYNKRVEENIKKVSDELQINFEKYSPKDKKNISHLLGIFEHDASYYQFITQGAKKYAYIDKKDEKIHITVSGVPKKGAKALKDLNDFKDDFIFSFKDTNKNLLVYNDDMNPFILKDYKGKKLEVTDKYGCILIPTTYKLGKAEEYANLIEENSSRRSRYNE